MLRYLILALALVIPAACQQQGEQAGTTEETPAIDAAAVEQSIRDGADRFEQAMLAGDAAALSSFYADDAVVLAQGQPKVEGIDAIRAEFDQMSPEEARPTAFSLDPESIVVSASGDMAYDVGTFTYTGPGPDGTEMTDNGKYVAIWKPAADGTWKIAVDIWNSDAMPGAPAEGGTEAAAAPSGQ
jgi:uncharacterized protein (TIGR02246 family)